MPPTTRSSNGIFKRKHVPASPPVSKPKPENGKVSRQRRGRKQQGGRNRSVQQGPGEVEETPQVPASSSTTPTSNPSTARTTYPVIVANPLSKTKIIADPTSNTVGELKGAVGTRKTPPNINEAEDTLTIKTKQLPKDSGHIESQSEEAVGPSKAYGPERKEPHQDPLEVGSESATNRASGTQPHQTVDDRERGSVKHERSGKAHSSKSAKKQPKASRASTRKTKTKDNTKKAHQPPRDEGEDDGGDWTEPSPLPEARNLVHPRRDRSKQVKADRVHPGLKGYTGRLTSPKTRGLMSDPAEKSNSDEASDDDLPNAFVRKEKIKAKARTRCGRRKDRGATPGTSSKHWANRPKCINGPESQLSAIRFEETSRLQGGPPNTSSKDSPPHPDEANSVDLGTANAPKELVKRKNRPSRVETELKQMRQEARFRSSSVRFADLLTEETNKTAKIRAEKIPVRKSGPRETDALKAGSLSQSSSSLSGSRKRSWNPTESEAKIDTELQIQRHRSGRPSVSRNKGKPGLFAWAVWAMEQRLNQNSTQTETAEEENDAVDSEDIKDESWASPENTHLKRASPPDDEEEEAESRNSPLAPKRRRASYPTRSTVQRSQARSLSEGQTPKSDQISPRTFRGASTLLRLRKEQDTSVEISRGEDSVVKVNDTEDGESREQGNAWAASQQLQLENARASA